MASQDEIESFIKCHVCLDVFDGQTRIPKLLSCSHSVCLQCLEVIYLQSTHQGQIVCPECRTLTGCDGGIHRLSTNRAVLQLIQMNDERRRFKLTILNERLEVASLVDELIRNHLGDRGPAFFQGLNTILHLVVKETRCLAPIWNIQNDWNDNTEMIWKLYQTVLSFVPQMEPEQLDYLISDVQTRFTSTDNVLERLNLLDFVCRLANATSHQSIISQALNVIGAFLWCRDTPIECQDHCIQAFKKILDKSWNSDVVTPWIRKCIDSIRTRKRSVVAIKLLRQLCFMYASKAAAANDHYQSTDEFSQLVLLKYKQIYDVLDHECQVFDSVVDDLLFYCVGAARLAVHGDRHALEIQTRLDFMVAFYKYGRKLIDRETAERVWISLVERSPCPSDRETGFDYFTKIQMTAESNRRIFHHHLIKLDPNRMTLAAINCFQHLFRAVEYDQGDVIFYDVDLQPAIEFLWNVVGSSSPEPIRAQAFQLLRETIVYLGPQSIHLDMKIEADQLANRLDRIPLEQQTTSMELGDVLSNVLAVSDEARVHPATTDIRMEVPRTRFDVGVSVFHIKVMKRSQIQGRIIIKPWLDFGSAKFMQELGDFCFGRTRKMGRLTKARDTSVNLKMKSAMFQPTVPELLNYRIWVDSDRTTKACQVGLTRIESSRDGSRIAGWQFVFLLRDVQLHSRGTKTRPSLLFGEVVQGIDLVKQFYSGSKLCWMNEGLSFSLEAHSPRFL